MLRHRMLVLLGCLCLLSVFIKCGKGQVAWHYPGEVETTETTASKDDTTDKTDSTDKVPCAHFINFFPDQADAIAIGNLADENGAKNSPLLASVKEITIVRNALDKVLKDPCAGVNLESVARCIGFAAKFKEPTKSSSGPSGGPAGGNSEAIPMPASPTCPPMKVNNDCNNFTEMPRNGDEGPPFSNVIVMIEGPDNTFRTFIDTKRKEMEKWREEVKANGKLVNGVLTCKASDGTPRMLSIPDQIEGLEVVTLTDNPFRVCSFGGFLTLVVSAPDKMDKNMDRYLLGTPEYLSQAVKKMTSTTQTPHRFGKYIQPMTGQVKVALGLLSLAPQDIRSKIEGFLLAAAKTDEKVATLDLGFDVAAPKASYDINVMIGDVSILSNKGSLNLDMVDRALVTKTFSSELLNSCINNPYDWNKDKFTQDVTKMCSKANCCDLASDAEKATLLGGACPAIPQKCENGGWVEGIK